MKMGQHVLAGLVFASLLSEVAFAQTGQQLPQQAARPERPAPQAMQVSVEMDRVLQEWEQKSSQFKRLQGSHDRYIYQPAFGLEIRAAGQYFFEAPDKGRIDIEPVEVPAGQQGARKGVNGQPMRISSAEPETWVADGAQILGMSESLGEKVYSRVEIPVQLRGENVADGPLPFLFGISAEKMKARYRLELGPQHNLDPAKGAQQIHVIAYPTRAADAQNWQRAEVLLEPKYFLPRAIRLRDGLDANATETVYVFDLNKMAANQAWRSGGLFRDLLPGFDPFRPDLRGYKLLEDHRIGQANPQQRGL